MQIGFIGTGSMGTILIQSFVESGRIHPSQIIASNRTGEKIQKLAWKYPGLQTGTNRDVAKNAALLFICVKPLNYRSVLDEVRDLLSPEKFLVSITSSVNVDLLESVCYCKTARVIPSITNAARHGASLITFGNRLQAADKSLLLRLMSAISTPVEIDDENTRISSDIVSCGPAFFSFLLQRFIDSAVQETGISEDAATKMMTQMIVGMGKLFEEERYTLSSLQEKVCVPGGVTGIGLHVLDKETADVFDHLIQATHRKFAEDVSNVKASFADKKNSLH
ncbi:late competence protein ComER [Aneurinibacillus terranovensis]|uniref:late competence protein ComER n=1 Tax=Aneurinibacillus terranovensis TaxID=278991 RepID=UPI0003FAA956|nr:late competence protein ComER [Aneurinibacillus terranovensis]